MVWSWLATASCLGLAENKVIESLGFEVIQSYNNTITQNNTIWLFDEIMPVDELGPALLRVLLFKVSINQKIN